MGMPGHEVDRQAAVVPAVGTAGSVATVRSLGRHGVPVIAVSEKRAPPSFSSRYCEGTLRVPPPQTDLQGYADALLELAARPDVATIVPVREEDIYVLAEHRDAFGQHMHTPWPTVDRLQDVHDRLELFAAAERAGVAYPETTLLDEVTDWDRERIVKGRHAILTADTAADLEEGRCESPPKTVFLEPGVEPDVDALVDAMGHVPIAQSYLSGPEYCFRGLYQNGEPLVTSQKRLRRGYKYSRGPSIYHEAVDDPRLEAAGRALLTELDWDGLASVGFIQNDEGTFELLEINPRTPASLPVDIHAGIDYPALYWDLARGRTPTESLEYRPGTASHLLRGEVVHLHSILREDYPLAERPSLPGTLWNVASSLVTQPRFDLLSLDDPKPFLRDVKNAIGSAARSS
jgi:predicted ATP-grasp superfamily ATP-dependent carboligase